MLEFITTSFLYTVAKDAIAAIRHGRRVLIGHIMQHAYSRGRVAARHGLGSDAIAEDARIAAGTNRNPFFALPYCDDKVASEHTNHEVAGVLWDSVLLCCASSCSGVYLQRTSRERGC